MQPDNICDGYRHYLKTGKLLQKLKTTEVGNIMLEHLDHLYFSQGIHSGTGITYIHVGWDIKGHPDSTLFLHQIKRAENTRQQLRITSQ